MKIIQFSKNVCRFSHISDVKLTCPEIGDLIRHKKLPCEVLFGQAGSYFSGIDIHIYFSVVYEIVRA